MTTVHQKRMQSRNSTLVPYNNGGDVEYVFSGFEGTRDKEEAANDQAESDKVFFATGWAKASFVQDKIDQIESKGGANQAQIWNRTRLKEVRLKTISYFHAVEDQVEKGHMRRSVAICRISAILARVQKLLKDKRLRLKSGQAWGQLAGLHNNGLSALENMGVQVANSRYIRNKFSKNEIFDHVAPEMAPTGREDRDGEDWADEIRQELYNVD